MHKTILYSFPAFLCVRDMGKIHKITGVFPFFQFFGEYFDSEFIKQSKEIYIIRLFWAPELKIYDQLKRFLAKTRGIWMYIRPIRLNLHAKKAMV
jgi:hypothetical protein